MLDWERADGEEGLLLVRGPGVFKGYWQDPETTAETFHGDYLVTGARLSTGQTTSLFAAGRSWH